MKITITKIKKLLITLLCGIGGVWLMLSFANSYAILYGESTTLFYINSHWIDWAFTIIVWGLGPIGFFIQMCRLLDKERANRIKAHPDKIK